MRELILEHKVSTENPRGSTFIALGTLRQRYNKREGLGFVLQMSRPQTMPQSSTPLKSEECFTGTD